MKDQVFSGEHSISAKAFSTGFRRACVPSCIKKSADVWVVTEFVKYHFFAAIKEQLNLSSNNVSQRNGTTTTYTEVVKHLIGRYATHVVSARADEKIRNFKHVSCTPRDFFESFGTSP